MENDIPNGCTPDKCDSCSGCSGNVIEKLTIRVEWRHKGQTKEEEEIIEKNVHEISSELIVSGVEVIYINNTFSQDILDNTSEFLINGHSLNTLVPEVPEQVSKEVLRKGIFQALLQNL